MTTEQREELGAIGRSLDKLKSIADMMASYPSLSNIESMAIEGLADALDGLSVRLDEALTAIK